MTATGRQSPDEDRTNEQRRVAVEDHRVGSEGDCARDTTSFGQNRTRMYSPKKSQSTAIIKPMRWCSLGCLRNPIVTSAKLAMMTAANVRRTSA
jgi:hypothetical protein